MDYSGYPLAVLFAYTNEFGELVFLGRDNPIVIHDHVFEILSVLRLCNGRAKLSEIRQELSHIPEDLFLAIIETCQREKVVIDSRALYTQFHLDSSNPQVYLTELDPVVLHGLITRERTAPLGEVVASYDANQVGLLAAAIQKRKSVRSFTNRGLSVSQIVQLLGSSYLVSEKNRPTPSGGKMYAHQVYVVSADDNQPLAGWVYAQDPVSGDLVKTGVSTYPEQVARSIDHPHSPPGVVLFITADVRVSATKYGNRAYRYALIEAGHIAQNAALVASEMGLGLLEYGGFDESATKEMLGLQAQNQEILLCLILGYEGDPEHPQFTANHRTLLHQIKSAYEGEGKPIEASTLIPLSAGKIRLPKVRAIASYQEVGGHSRKRGLIRQLLHQSTGVSTSTTMAFIKALAEGYERFVSGQTRWDRLASLEQLTGAGFRVVDPRIVVPYRSEQYLKTLRRLQAFDPSAVIQWVDGRSILSGECVPVPVDLVYYPIDERVVGRKLCCVATSSGVAAHAKYEEAVAGAMLELIERDAVAVLWYSRKQAIAAYPEQVSRSAQRRIQEWGRLGWEVKLLDITTDSVPVCLAVIYSNRRFPHFVSGAAASLDFVEAADKALSEAETMAVSWSTMRNRKISATEVKSVIDHAKFYFRRENLGLVDWLVDAPFGQLSKSFNCLSNLFTKFDPVVIDMDLAGDHGPLNVVRLISGALLPISFGFGAELIDHNRLEMLGLTYKRPFPSPPHFFA